MNILLLGSNGQLGSELKRQLPSMGALSEYSRSELDITNQKAVRDVCFRKSPDIIVNAAAYTAVEDAEKNSEAAYHINAKAVKNLANLAAEKKIWLIHYSTDYVFDGTKREPYSENDPVNPINVYGKSKLAGEHAIENAGCQHLIFRTTWVIGQEKTELR